MGGDLSERRSGFPAVLQHDSVLGPEECGGPVIDLAGRAIGINIARAGRTESYAIPDDVLRPLIDELLSGNYPPPGEHTPTLATEPGQESANGSVESDTAEN
jgi:serine protease Do